MVTRTVSDRVTLYGAKKIGLWRNRCVQTELLCLPRNIAKTHLSQTTRFIDNSAMAWKRFGQIACYTRARNYSNSCHGWDPSLCTHLKVRLKRERERAVDDASVHVRAEINLANVALLQDRRVAIVRRVVRRHVIQRAPGRKGETALEAVFAHQAAIAALNHVANVDHLHAGPHPPLHVRARLPVRLGRLANCASAHSKGSDGVNSQVRGSPCLGRSVVQKEG